MHPTPGLNRQAPTTFVTWPWGSRTPRLPCQLVLSPSPGLPSVAQACVLLLAFRLDPGNIFGSMLCSPGLPPGLLRSTGTKPGFPPSFSQRNILNVGTISLSIIPKLALGLDSLPLLSSHLTSLLVYSLTETAVGGRLCSKLFPYVHSILTRQVLTIPFCR